jgi:HTH-type transcriptional regulator, global nitrogen regulator NrpRI
MSFESQQDVERKILSILKVLSSVQGPAGSRVIAKRLTNHGVELSERAVRYHLKLTDERGLTELVTDRDGRIITKKGLKEIESALVNDKVGYVNSRIELLAFRTDFDYEKPAGLIPVNITFFPEVKFQAALQAMIPAFESGYCVGKLVAIAKGGQRIGEIIVPKGKVGLATVCSIVINGTMLKAGIPMDSKFGGILQLHNYKPVRFTQVIHYNGSSLDPSEIFIKAKMTSVREASLTGDGEILANFREIPAICRQTAENVITGLNRVGFSGVLCFGDTSNKVCETNVELNKVGIILMGGLNPVAAATEIGFESENRSMSTVINYGDLVDYRELIENTLYPEVDFELAKAS